MKKPISIFAVAIGVFAMTACSSSTTTEDEVSDKLEELLAEIEEEPEQAYDVKEVEDIYSMEIADYMTSTTVLNQDASLQFNNLYKEKYIIAIHEDKAEFRDVLETLGDYNEDESLVDNYARIQLEFFRGASTVAAESDIKSEKVDGMEARLIAIDADVAGVPESISYWMGYIEGEETLYTVMAWTLESRKDDFEKEANKMIRSLKEL